MCDLLELIMEILGNSGGDWAFSGRSIERSDEEIARDMKWNVVFVVVILIAIFAAGCCMMVIGLKGIFEKGEAGGLLTAAFGAATVVGLLWLVIQMMKSRMH